MPLTSGLQPALPQPPSRLWLRGHPLLSSSGAFRCREQGRGVFASMALSQNSDPIKCAAGGWEQSLWWGSIGRSEVIISQVNAAAAISAPAKYLLNFRLLLLLLSPPGQPSKGEVSTFPLAVRTECVQIHIWVSGARG